MNFKSISVCAHRNYESYASEWYITYVTQFFTH